MAPLVSAPFVEDVRKSNTHQNFDGLFGFLQGNPLGSYLLVYVVRNDPRCVLLPFSFRSLFWSFILWRL